MRALLLWSGGIESTSVLLMLLRYRPDVELAVHYVARRNGLRGAIEERYVHSLLPVFQAIRSFTFYQSEVSLGSANTGSPLMPEGNIPFDYEVDYPLSIHLMRHHKVHIVYRCRCLEDDWNHYRTLDANGRMQVFAVKGDGQNQDKRIAPLKIEYADPRTVAAFPTVYHMPKAWHWRELGEYAQSTWSCRTPTKLHKPCFTCHSCREREAAAHGHSAIKDIDNEILCDGLPPPLTTMQIQQLTRTRYEYDSSRILQEGAGAI